MALTKLKIAVVAPIPRARVAITTAVKPGVFFSMRTANLRSFMVVQAFRCEAARAGCNLHNVTTLMNSATSNIKSTLS